MRAQGVLLLGVVGISMWLVFLLYSQELELRERRSRADELDERMITAEDEIAQNKQRIQDTQAKELGAKAMAEELRASQQSSIANGQQEVAKLQACQIQQKDIEGKKKAALEELQKLKVQQEQQWKTAEQAINALKQQVEEKNKICPYVDKTKEEAKKICG
ncbi:outer membrane protein 26 [Amia ocellicauda]|uniref:outer membrane protein 26 n=1 Tax=Amia ocellicauda TaxID=2972642 RepID=UPI003463D9FC